MVVEKLHITEKALRLGELYSDGSISFTVFTKSSRMQNECRILPTAWPRQWCPWADPEAEKTYLKRLISNELEAVRSRDAHHFVDWNPGASDAKIKLVSQTVYKDTAIFAKFSTSVMCEDLAWWVGDGKENSNSEKQAIVSHSIHPCMWGFV